MTEGSQNYFLNGLKRGFPAQWSAATTNFLQIFNVLTDPNVLYNAAQNKDALLNCFAYGLNVCYQELQYILPQLDLQTATGNSLDLISLDYLGNAVPRSPGQSDASYRQQIEANFFNIGPTEANMLSTLTKLYTTGFRILQGIPQEQAWNISNWGYDSPTAVWASRNNTAQVLIQAPPAQTRAQQQVNNAAIALTRPAGVRVWMTTSVYGPPQPLGGAYVPPRIPGKSIGAPYIMTYGSVLFAIIGGQADPPVIMTGSSDLLAAIAYPVPTEPVIMTGSSDLLTAIAYPVPATPVIMTPSSDLSTAIAAS